MADCSCGFYNGVSMGFAECPLHGTDFEDESIADCWHSWVNYVGFREVYQYCEKCGEKNE